MKIFQIATLTNMLHKDTEKASCGLSDHTLSPFASQGLIAPFNYNLLL